MAAILWEFTHHEQNFFNTHVGRIHDGGSDAEPTQAGTDRFITMGGSVE
jgi:hypothetical protein